MGKLHVLFLPLMAHGHMIPMFDMAKLFSSRGLKTTIISTPAFSDPITRAQQSGSNIGLTIIKFPPQGSELPDHFVSLDQITTDDLLPKFMKALALLQEPVEKLIQELNPNCLVSDMFLPWTTDSAAKFRIPRLVFHGTSHFALCAQEQMKRHKPFNTVSSDTEPFVLPNLPHELTFVRTQIAPHELEEKEDGFTELRAQMREADKRSYGVIVNSFYELEPDYADYYTKVLGRKAWHIGPLLMHNNIEAGEKAQRGKKSDISEHECLAWLDLKRPNSVVYVCFGSMARFSPRLLNEIAIGLEESTQDFIWVVRKGKNGEGEEEEDWLPGGFEERTKGKGLIIRGWAPQVIILDHVAVGAFVTHCGWNSTLEGICAGVSMVTWPLFAEQFFNEKLVTEVLRTGVSVGNKKWQRVASEGVSSEAMAKVVGRVMVGEEALEMRKRANYFKEMARKSIEEGGSSVNDLNNLIEELIKCL